MVLCGLPGARLAQAGLALSGITGLPLRLVGRSVEHVAGRSRSRIAHEDGIATLRAREREQIERAQRQRPPALVVAPEGAELPEPDAAAPSTWAYLHRPAGELLDALHQQHMAEPGSIPEFVVGPPIDATDLRDRMVGLDRCYREGADHVVDCTGVHPHGAARAIVDVLGWELGG